MRKKYVLLYAANIAPVGVGEMRKNIEFMLKLRLILDTARRVINDLWSRRLKFQDQDQDDEPMPMFVIFKLEEISNLNIQIYNIQYSIYLNLNHKHKIRLKKKKKKN